MASKLNEAKIHSSEAFPLHLPKIFPTMTEPDTIIILHWHVREGDILQPPDPNHPDALLEVVAPYGEIEISIPPFLQVPHRVVRILKPESMIMHLGDQFIILQALEDVA